MRKVTKSVLVVATGWLILIPSQLASAQVRGIELESSTNQDTLESLRRVLPLIPRDVESRELELLDDKPLLQNDLPVRQENEVVCDDEGILLEAGGWVDNGDGTFSMIPRENVVCLQ